VDFGDCRGTPQGAGTSPLLAKLFLHYALDLWVHWWRAGGSPTAAAPPGPGGPFSGRHHARLSSLTLVTADERLLGLGEIATLANR
jgi:hypothetical protein